MDEAVTELQLRSFDSRVVDFERLVGTAHGCARGFSVGFQRIVVSAKLTVLLAGHDALLDQLSISFYLGAAPVFLCNFARQIRLGLFLRGEIFGEVRLRLSETRFEWARVDRKKHLALLY